jgi:prophage regulatory protein
MNQTSTMQRFLRRTDVQQICGLPTSTLYDLMDKGEFPKPIKLSARTVAWLEADIIEWQDRKITARDIHG